ncbi:hypothetical protein [Candidatus Nucleicultrix amoebiphila]|jgi:hypothetical protein|nr:hypothetical protein [Candidatus Nucleicultrix amoebiphila]
MKKPFKITPALRKKNIALLVILGVLVLLIYGLAIVRMKGM